MISYPQISDLVGKTLVAVQRDEVTVTFTCDDGTRYRLYHDQDCCESVYIESVVGDLGDLVGSPITMADESSSRDIIDGKPENPDSFTWTFYKLATVKGYVDIRFLGESNGYYGEGVSFDKVDA